MNKIQVLDQITIDQIAAGEVIERPASVVKELVENAVDAGATAVTTEIRDGGISFIRIADNGCGIEEEDVRAAFLRHSTSKIRSVDDLIRIGTLGFRGEALSSIAAVSQVELVTKTKNHEYGICYRIAGGKEESLEETGAKEGTTFFIRQLFYNTPARKKFLKTAMTEAGYVSDLMTRMALSHPEISFRFINNGQEKLHTSGNGNLKEVIYHVYGREIASNLLPVDFEKDQIRITGFLGKPVISRGNRNFENYFVGGRYIKSSMVYKAIEDAYRDFTMQHKYPFVVLNIEVNDGQVDVNVHPTKMDVRFGNQQKVYNAIYEAVNSGLHREELIPPVTLEPETPHKDQTAEPARVERTAPAPVKKDLNYFMEEMKKRVASYHAQNSSAEVKNRTELFKPDRQADRIREAVTYHTQPVETLQEKKPEIKPEAKPEIKPEIRPEAKPEVEPEAKPQQMHLFEDKLLSEKSRPQHKIIGQVFDTYWLVEYHDNLYIIDQHAAHERVLYEKTLKGMQTRTFTSQMISPPIILNLTMQESELLKTYMDQFTRIGFEFEEFGQESYAVRAVPDNLFSIAKKDLLMDMLDNLSEGLSRNMTGQLIDEKIASMSCKAAVKGNMHLSVAEADALIGELLTLENPYHCPHGRPTIISMSKRELEKKFKRIV